MFAARVEYVAGAGLHGDAQTERVQPPGEAAGAGGEVVGEGVEVHVVEGQADAVVAEVGEEGQGVVEAEVGEAVGAVAEAERVGGGTVSGPVRTLFRVPAHVMLTFLMADLFANHRPAGARAATRRDVALAPERAASAAWSGIVARMPPPTARRVSGGEGLSAAWK